MRIDLGCEKEEQNATKSTLPEEQGQRQVHPFLWVHPTSAPTEKRTRYVQ